MTSASICPPFARGHTCLRLGKPVRQFAPGAPRVFSDGATSRNSLDASSSSEGAPEEVIA